jgi:DNA-binding NarL/FixJ family response regulator
MVSMYVEKRKIVKQLLVRKGLAEMLKQNNYDICGESVDIENAFEGILDSTPDLVILDLSLGGENGVDLIKKMKKNKNKTPVLVFSMHEDSFHVQQAIKSGARGYVTKQEIMDTLLDAVQEILSGKSYFSRRVADAMIESLAEHSLNQEENQFELLSKREREVYIFLGEGYSFSEIAEKLMIRPKTVESYLARIKIKLNLNRNRDLLRHAIKHSSQIEL